ncbi:DNA polymerase III subunit alpha [Desulfonatronovibrio hydrogenovorans]|uniref:DNA polymerase III subunit alpha n=1 Tax=Desulfonatronovibrio hydrogenovorans TaxID=53245 RepID=UPI0004904F5B|nr:DNA polymerase III subunit alpha [Desulfonatronovibrio hydrogenovorans]
MSNFTHLHCHTEYSLLDGAIRIDDLCSRAVDLGMPAAAITDHGNLFGALTFYLTAKKYGIKPIIGCEVYVAHRKHTDRDQLRYHLVLLAMDNGGYQNLVKIVTKGWLQGFYYKPRVDKQILREHSQGLIALSACLQGEVQHVMRRKGFEQAEICAREYADIFPGRFYLELEANGIREQEEVNEKLIEMSAKTRLPLVATNDCHYLSAQDVEAHDTLLCIQTNSRIDDDSRMRFDTSELYYKSLEEMEKEFGHCPAALESVHEIISRCDLQLEIGRHHFPKYEPSRAGTLDEEFITLAREGLEQRIKSLPYEVEKEVYYQRLEEETGIICDKGYPGYFLIVQDFINWAKAQDIPVGPGRGSAAGSLAAYALGITDLDPIRYTLLFERFLNVERASMPDIDVDFCYDQREKVIRYVSEKYGQDSVAQITTFGTMKAKAVIRDVGRAMGISLAQVDKIAKLIPDELKMTIDKALEREPDLAKAMDEDERIAKLIDIGRRLEGLVRHASTHAAGIVISDKAMDEYLPLYKGKKGEVVTQYDMKRVEKVGLIKFDFLGLKTLTVISDTLGLIKISNKPVPDMNTLALDDSRTYDLLGQGLTDGVFQLESSGMRNVLTDLKPTCFEDIIALLALYRPGPLESGMVSDFIKRKHGRVPVEYPHPDLEPILKETYGVILYQEQVMKIAQVLAGYSLGDGDMLRRAMGKKEAAVMAQQRSKFLQGAKKNGVPQDSAEYIFDLMEKFAGYGFNKSHSAAYALISYQTAYLKAHYPHEFMAALITSEVNNTDKVIAHVNACRDLDIEILPPCINSSLSQFSVEQDRIRFGLNGIKNVGKGAIESITRERDKNGPYKNLLDFCDRVNMRKVTKRVVEMLIKSGAMDCLGCSRKGLLEGMELVVARSQRSAKQKSLGRPSLLSLVSKDTSIITGLGINCPENTLPEYLEDEKLKLEKESLGFYLSGHPLLPFKKDIKRMNLKSIQECCELSPSTEIELPVVIVGKKEITSKKGDRMAFCQIEDLTGSAEVTFFGDVYAKCRTMVDSDEPLVVKARISNYQGGMQAESNDDGETPKKVKFTALEVCPLQEVIASGSEPVMVDLFVDGDCQELEALQSLQGVLDKHPGKVPVQMNLMINKEIQCRLQLGPRFRITPCQQFWQDLSGAGFRQTG